MWSYSDNENTKLSSEVHHRLKSLEQIRRYAGDVGVSVIQPRQNKSRHQRLENGPVDTSYLTQYGEAGADGLRDMRPRSENPGYYLRSSEHCIYDSDGHFDHTKRAKSLPPDTFPGLKNYQNCFCGWSSSPDPDGELTALSRPRAGKGRIA